MKILILCALFLVMGTSYAQTEKSYQFGIQVNLEEPLIRFYSFYDLNKIFTPLFTYSNAKHQFEIGPSFAPLRRPEYELKLGARIGYTFYPNGRNSLFNSYLTFAIPFQLVKDNPVTYVPNDLGSSVVPLLHEYWSVHAQGGYGIQLKMGERFYLGSDISMLFGIIVQDYEFKSSITEVHESRNRRYLFLHPQFGVNVGFRF